MKNETPFNVLCSFAYIANDKNILSLIQRLTTSGEMNLMIDSGAFTKHNAKGNFDHINLDSYCSFLDEFAPFADKYVMLDVIGNRNLSVCNYETMLKRGLNPMFVFTTYDTDFAYLREAVRNNRDICVAGGATTKNDWTIKRYQDAYLQTDKQAKIHALGYFTVPNVFRLNLCSFDSSSFWTAATRFGQIVYWDATTKTTTRISHADVLRDGKKLPRNLTQMFEKYKITPLMYQNKNYHCKDVSIELFINIISNLQLQQYCWKQGLRYFFAVSNYEQLQKILFIRDNPGITYWQFLREFKR